MTKIVEHLFVPCISPNKLWSDLQILWVNFSTGKMENPDILNVHNIICFKTMFIQWTKQTGDCISTFMLHIEKIYEDQLLYFGHYHPIYCDWD